jgi:hypothetical protein
MLDLKLKSTNTEDAYIGMSLLVMDQSQSMSQAFDFDCATNQLSTFLGTNTCYVIPELSACTQALQGSLSIDQAYLATNTERVNELTLSLF